MTYKVGDKCIILDKRNDHRFIIGEEVEICESIFNGDLQYNECIYKCGNRTATWFVLEGSLRLVIPGFDYSLPDDLFII